MRVSAPKRNRSITHPYPYDELNGLIKIPRHVENELKVLAKNGKKPEAMKQVMDLTGVGLRAAKDYIDSLL